MADRNAVGKTVAQMLAEAESQVPFMAMGELQSRLNAVATGALVVLDAVVRLLPGAVGDEHVRVDVHHPLDDGAPLHGGVLDGHHLGDGAVGDHHAADVDAQVAREALQRVRQLDQQADARVARVEPSRALRCE